MTPGSVPAEAPGDAGELPVPPGRAARGGQALQKAVQYLTWLVPVLEKFPRSQRFLLGDRLQSLALAHGGRPGGGHHLRPMLDATSAPIAGRHRRDTPQAATTRLTAAATAQHPSGIDLSRS